MPIYEYQCSKCDHYFEALQKVSDQPLRECPECGKHALKRLMSAPLFRLAGSGWYETDFKSDNEAKRNLAGEKAEPVEGGGAAKAEPKAEPKAPAAPAAEEKKASRTMVTKPATKSKSVARPAKRPARKVTARGRKR